MALQTSCSLYLDSYPEMAELQNLHGLYSFRPEELGNEKEGKKPLI